MSILKIQRTSDTYECDTCGGSYADGADVYLDDKLILELTASAHCYDGTSYTDCEIFTTISQHLGLNWPEDCDDQEEYIRWMATHNYRVELE